MTMMDADEARGVGHELTDRIKAWVPDPVWEALSLRLGKLKVMQYRIAELEERIASLEARVAPAVRIERRPISDD
jgi:hypothetical protein